MKPSLCGNAPQVYPRQEVLAPKKTRGWHKKDEAPAPKKTRGLPHLCGDSPLQSEEKLKSYTLCRRSGCRCTGRLERFAMLDLVSDRRGHKERGVGADDDAQQDGEGEALDRGPAEEEDDEDYDERRQ